MSAGRSSAAKSLVGFAIYMTLSGLTLVLVPNVLLGIVRLPPTNEVWLRVLGMFMVIVSYYYLQAARSEATPFFRATVRGRTLMALFLAVLAFSGPSLLGLLAFALFEFLGAMWTAASLRSKTGVPEDAPLPRT